MNRLLGLLLMLLSIPSLSQNLSVLFDTGKYSLSQKEKNRLDSLIYTFETELFYELRLIGHTDSVGSYKGNKILSEKRAQTVEKYLRRKSNVKFSVLKGDSYSFPVESNATETGRTKNRRCDIYITAIITTKEQWKITAQSFRINNSDSVILYTRNGCKFFIEAGSFPISDNDTVSIHITEYNNPVDFIAGGLPMSYSANGRDYMYQSEQMMKIEAFKDTIPLKLMKLIGLQGHNVDLSNNVRFYEFRGQENKWMNVSKKIIHGQVEVLPKKKKSEITNLSGTSISENVPDADKEQETKKTADRQEEKTDKKGINIKLPQLNLFNRKPDDRESFILEPDTTRGSGSDYYTYIYYLNGKGTTAKDTCNYNLCDTASIIEGTNYGFQFKNKFNVPDNVDISSYFTRYKNLHYDGMTIKYTKEPADLYKTKVHYKKKAGHKMVVTIVPTSENPEYKPLKRTKWILNYGWNINDIEMLKRAEVADFRILPITKEDYPQYSKDNYFIEIKSDSAFYRFPVKSKRTKKTKKAYLKYEKLYRDRVIAFDDSIRKFISDYRIPELKCVFKITKDLSQWEKIAIGCHVKSWQCSPFTFFNSPYASKYENLKLDRLTEEQLYFQEWIKFYNNNIDLFQKELEHVKSNASSIASCKCPKPVHYEVEDLCYKWEYADANPIGKNIIHIGLGIYNFDREMALEKKQRITDAVYLSTKGDTLLKCNYPLLYGKLTKKCNHEAFTIIPGFNGLMKQNNTAVLTLLPGKENVLFFINYNRKYKLYLDLRKVEKYKGSTFILKDITEEAATMEGLIEELEKP